MARRLQKLQSIFYNKNSFRKLHKFLYLDCIKLKVSPNNDRIKYYALL